MEIFKALSQKTKELCTREHTPTHQFSSLFMRITVFFLVVGFSGMHLVFCAKFGEENGNIVSIQTLPFK